MTDNAELQSVPINPTARIVFSALEQMGWSVENPSLLVEHIKRLDIGIPAEDEFAVLISWMGKCELVHKLEQEQSPPESQNAYRIPDLLAFFRHKNRLVPVLIEVKKRKAEKLSWKPEYLDGLRQYATTLNLPLLVAWKWEPFGFWTLFEAKHFSKARKNYEITQELSMKENLMSLLAGDFAVGLRKGVGFHLIFRKEKELKSGDAKNSDTKTWLARVEEAFFTNGRGERVKELGPGLWSLLLCAHLEEHSEVSEAKASSSFIIEEESIEFTHRMLTALLQFKAGKDKPLRWREIRQNYSVPIKFQILRKAAIAESSVDIVAKVIEVAPNTKPDFLTYE
jgi:Holliday junction resolvase